MPLWHNLSLAEVWRKVASSARGLTVEEAALRLRRFGRNELPQPTPTSLSTLFFRQFASTLIVVLLIAAGLALTVGELADALVILVAVVVNVVVGFSQERRAETALHELRQLVKYQARVVRDGQELLVPVEVLVPGDIIRLTAGDRVPADARLVTSHELETNEALLTGESQPVSKQVGVAAPGAVIAERTNMLYLGTSVTRGETQAVVVVTGSKTELGTIAELINNLKDEPTPLQNRLARFGQGVGAAVGLICVVILFLGVALGYPFRQMFTTAVAIAVAAVPEGLVVVVTAILALGMRRILKKNVLVRRLVAAETLGSTTVICVDKTGTLTQGEMRVSQIITPDEELNPFPAEIEDGSSPWALLKIGILASDAYVANPRDELKEWVVVGNPTERALVLAGQQAGLDIEHLRRNNPRLGLVPFSSERKYMLTWHKTAGGSVAYLKGAPEKVLAACSQVRVLGDNRPLEDGDRRKFLHDAERASKQGLRVLAFAVRDFLTPMSYLAEPESWLNNFVFVGFVGIKDPLRPEVTETIRTAWRAGIRLVMITGDHQLTARAIAEEIGFPSAPENVMEGERLAAISDADLKQRVADISVFARTAPKDKLRIVNAWQKRGEVVAMTGDGVNDSPALKAADIGVALGSGSDVAKEAADMVLLDNNVASIVAAVEEGRTIYDNIRKVVLYLMSDSFAEMALILGAFVVGLLTGRGLELPVLATQILWVNLVCDSFPAIALTTDPASSATMTQAPLRRSQPILDWPRKLLVVFLSLIKGGGSLLVFLFFIAIGSELDHARTVVFTLLALTSLAYTFSLKHLDHPLWHPMTWNNPRLIWAILVGLGLQLLAVYMPFLQKVFHTVPLQGSDWLLIVSFCALVVFMLEAVKYFAANRRSYQLGKA